MRSILLLAFTLPALALSEVEAVTLESTHMVVNAPRTNLYLLADRTERLDRKVLATSTGIENIGAMIEFLAGTEYGPKQVPEHLINFMEELKEQTESLDQLNQDARGALETKPSESGRFAAEALKARTLALRTHLESLRAHAHTLCENIKKHKAVFGDASFAAARKIAHETTPALASAGEALVATADSILQKAK